MSQIIADEVLTELVDTEFCRIQTSCEHPEQLEGDRRLFADYLGWRMDALEFASRVGGLREYGGSDKDYLSGELDKLATNLVKTGRETGRRYDSMDLVTPQELALIQSGTEGAKNISSTSNPYRPFAFGRFKNADVANVMAQRAKIGFRSAHSFYFGLDVKRDYGIGKGYVRITSEPLDDKGNTIRDPQPLDEKMQIMAAYTKSANFPFRRD